jgi:hypothetical protein
MEAVMGSICKDAFLRGPRAAIGAVVRGVIALAVLLCLATTAAAQQSTDPYAPSNGRVEGRVEGDRWIPDDREQQRAVRPPVEREPERITPYARPELSPSEPRRGERYDSDRTPTRDYAAPRRPEYRDDGPRYREDRGQSEAPRRRADRDRAPVEDDTYESDELLRAGHSFFGSVSRNLARAVESVISRSGRPNGYILGEDAGGAFVAGLRYGEGRLFTKRFGERRVYWQGPSIGYDFGGEGSKVMVLVYNLRRPSDIFRRFGGVQGAAYMVGGVSVQFQKNEDILLAPIRAGVGLRLGANVGYLKYTRRPTWNPF